VRYNDVRVVFDAGPLRYARLALVMRVRDEDVVLIRLYREPPDIGKRSAARESLDALLGTMLEFVPASDAEAWAIVPVASVHDVWKLVDDVRKRGRYFVNQFVGAYTARRRLLRMRMPKTTLSTRHHSAAAHRCFLFSP
jgi:hypothetical protein